MVNLADLLLPILLSGVAVFFISFVMWMVLPHHRSDFGKLPDEDAVMSALGDVKAGQYMFPHIGGPENWKDEALIAKREKGPSGLVSILPRGPQNMGKNMAISLVYNLVVSVFVAYLATVALEKATAGRDVLQFTSTATFMGYGLGVVWNPIWFGASWSSTFKTLFDCLIYGLASGAIFMAMWPSA